MKIKWNDLESIKTLSTICSNNGQLLEQMGYSKLSASNRRKLNRILNDLDLHLTTKRDYESILPNVIPDCLCISDVVRAVGLAPRGGNERTVRNWINKLGLDTSHFDVNKAKARKSKKTIDELFCENSKSSNGVIRQRILKDNIFDYVCSGCGLNGNDLWNGKPIVLQLDHIDGDGTNNTINNLRFMCPNCHSQTDTWGRRADII